LAIFAKMAGDTADPGLVGAAVADWTTSFHGLLPDDAALHVGQV